MKPFCVIGTLSAVPTLEATELNSTISFSWMVPAYRNINGISKDGNTITYCVEILNQTSTETLLNRCGIVETEFSYSTPADGMCHALRFSVSPVNPVGEGDSKSLVYYSPPTCKLLRSQAACINYL